VSYIVRDGKRIAVETIETAAAPRRSKGKRPKPFVISDVQQLLAAANAVANLGGRALLVWHYILYETRLRNTDTVSLSNVKLAEWGVTRHLKYKALDRLATAGLISIERVGKRRSPRVTLLAACG
jgi:hypothetical protein